MIVAITGGAGFIGKKLALKHLALGDQVRFLTRNKKSLSILPGAQGYLGDITIPGENVKKFIQGADVLYHLAAEIKDEKLMQSVNVDGTRNLLNLAEGNIDCWVQLSSTGVYGKAYSGTVTENSLLNPGNVYERSKAEADRVVSEFCREKKLVGCLLRPSNVFGAEMPNQSLFQLISMVNKGLFFFVGKKGAIVNYIHVDNVVNALICCAKELPNRPENFSIYIVSDHCSLEKMIEIFASSLDRDVPRFRVPIYPLMLVTKLVEKIPGMPLKQSRIDALTSRVIYSSQLIQDAIGFCKHISIEEGFNLLVTEWKRSNG